MGTLPSVLRNFGLDIPKERLAEAVDNSSFAAMSAHEARTTGSKAQAKSGERVMRRGKIGEWQEWMTPRLHTYFTGPEARRVAAHYGYDLALHQPAPRDIR